MNSRPADRPTRTRFVLVAWLCGLAGVLYLDRICMSQAVKPIRDQLELSNTQVSYVAMAFTLAYGLFEIPTGRLGDRIGARAVLTRIVIWWSVFTMLTGAAFGFVSLLIIRFLFGAGEAGAYPNAARVISRWFPAGERGRVQGVMLTAAQLGAVTAPYLAAVLIEHAGWRWAFVVFGLVGIVWAAGFWIWFRDDPATHPGVNAAELAVIRAGVEAQPANVEPIPWRAVARSRGVWMLGLAMVASAFNAYFYYTWFPTYLQDARGLSNLPAGRLSSLVLAGGAAGVLVGGIVADRLHRGRIPTILARRVFGGGVYLVAAGCLAIGISADDATTLAVFAALSCFVVHLTLPTWWSAAIEQSGRHVGSLFGLMNSMGVVGALVSQWFVGALVDWRKDLGFTGREQWDAIFPVYVGALLVGAIAWAVYRGGVVRS
jgi:MFS transporter, ACS family, glucarate transporter